MKVKTILIQDLYRAIAFLFVVLVCEIQGLITVALINISHTITISAYNLCFKGITILPARAAVETQSGVNCLNLN